MGGDIGAAETADVVHVALDALFATFGAFEAVADGIGHAQGIVGGDIEGVGTACLFETGACASDNRQTTADGLDDRDAKAFVDTGIDETFGAGIKGGEVGVGYAMEDVETMV